MSYEYSAQNHDWDLTLRAASDLVTAGIYLSQKPGEGKRSMAFSHFTGGMVLSFAAVESFSASVAFCMASDPRYSTFDFESYRRTFRFDTKMNMLMEAAGIDVDWGHGLFQRIATMQRWRNASTAIPSMWCVDRLNPQPEAIASASLGFSQKRGLRAVYGALKRSSYIRGRIQQLALKYFDCSVDGSCVQDIGEPVLVPVV